MFIFILFNFFSYCDSDASKEDFLSDEDSIIENRILYFLYHNEELLSLMRMKLSSIDSFQKSFSSILLADSFNFEFNDKKYSISSSFKFSQIIKIAQIFNKNKKDIIEALISDKDNLINSMFCEKILDSLKFEYLTRYIHIVDKVLEQSNLSDLQKKDILNIIRYDNSKFERESLYLSGVSEIYLSKSELDQILFMSKKVNSDFFFIEDDILKIADIQYNFKVHSLKHINKENFSGFLKINFGAILSYFLNNKHSKLKKSFDKTYKNLKQSNKVAVLFFKLNSDSDDIVLLEQKILKLKLYLDNNDIAFENYNDVLRYLQLEKLYMDRLNEYATNVFKIKETKKELGYYMYKMVEHSNDNILDKL